MARQIPVLLIAGFLGSGKTTLLNHLLTQQKGMRIAVIVNDFGDINIDSSLVVGAVDKKVELTNGCICCETGEEGIGEVFESLAHAGSILDAIIIEASGLADPNDTVRTIGKLRNPYVRFDSTVYVVDARMVLELRKKHADIDRHVAGADCVIINKIDEVSPEQLDEVRAYIRERNTKAMVLEASHGEVDTRLLLSGSERAIEASHEHRHGHMHSEYRQTTFETSEDIDPIKLFSLLEQPPEGVYRMKGMVNFGMKGMGRQYVFQFVAGRHEIRVLPFDRSARPRTELVVIGDEYDEVLLLARLNSLIDDGSVPLSAESMLSVEMFE